MACGNSHIVLSPPMPVSSVERWWIGQRPRHGYCCGKDCLWRNDPPGSS